MNTGPHPSRNAFALRSTFSRKGRSEEVEQLRDSLTSPLAGEGGSQRPERCETDEGPWVSQKRFVRQLRANMTDEEVILWTRLRSRKFENFKFRRQVAIGRYVVDFVCFEKRLIVELDGTQHQESVHDEVRDAWLKSQNFRILRFWNVSIREALDGCLLAILDALNQTPHPALRATFSRKGRSKE